jgi:TPR repeat protein
MMDDFEIVTSDDPAVSRILTEARTAEDAGRTDDAIAMYRKAGDAGCTDATVHLAMMLMDSSDNGRKEAVALLRKACEAGNASAARRVTPQLRGTSATVMR